jgi:hypothetical protein
LGGGVILDFINQRLQKAFSVLGVLDIEKIEPLGYKEKPREFDDFEYKKKLAKELVSSPESFWERFLTIIYKISNPFRNLSNTIKPGKK